MQREARPGTMAARVDAYPLPPAQTKHAACQWHLDTDPGWTGCGTGASVAGLTTASVGISRALLQVTFCLETGQFLRICTPHYTPLAL